MGRWLAGLALAIIAVLTLSPGASSARTHASALGLFAATDFLHNILLFVPLGLALALAGQGRGRVIAGAFCCSCTIELLQWYFIPSRFANLSDIVANTSGAALGQMLMAWAPGLIRPSRKAARTLGLLAGAGWMLTCLASAWSLQPDLPQTRTWWGQWAHQFPGSAPFPGQVVAFEVNGRAIPDDSLPGTAGLRTALATEGVHMVIRASGLTAVAGRAQVAALADGAGNMIVAVEQEGCMLRLVARRRADQVGFRVPAVNLPDVCAPGVDTVTVAASSTRDGMRLSLVSAEGLRTAVLPIRPTLGWSLVELRPNRVIHPELHTLIWVAFLVVPVVFWRMSGGQTSHAGRAVLPLFLLGSTAFISFIFGQSHLTPIDVLAMATGGGIAAAAHRALGTRGRSTDAPAADAEL